MLYNSKHNMNDFYPIVAKIVAIVNCIVCVRLPTIYYDGYDDAEEFSSNETLYSDMDHRNIPVTDSDESIPNNDTKINIINNFII